MMSEESWDDALRAGPGPLPESASVAASNTAPPRAAPPLWRRPALWTGSASLLFGLLLAALGYLPYSHPTTTIRQWAAAMSQGDVAKLRSEQKIGARAWINTLVAELGDADYRRVIEIYDRAAQSGRVELNRIANALESGGAIAFARLTSDQQRWVNRQSHNDWVCEHGLPQVTEASGVGGCAALLAEPSAVALIRQLGNVALTAEDQTLLGDRDVTDPTVAADPALADLAQRRVDEGLRAVSRLRDRVTREGERAFRQLPWSERGAVDLQSHRRYVREQGFAALAPDDRAMLVTSDAIENDPSTLAERLGLQQLTPAERTEISNKTREDFVIAHDVFVELTGVRLARRLLVSAFGRSDYSVRSLQIVGDGGRDLIRRDHARAKLRWNAIGNGLTDVPDEISMVWSTKDACWNIATIEWAARNVDNTSATALHPAGATSGEQAPTGDGR